MMPALKAFLASKQRFLALSVTIAMFFAAYAFGAFRYEAMRDPQIFFNLFRSYPFLLISAIGMTFVIVTGGIDLSVSGVVALVTVVSAALLRAGWNAWLVILLVLALGTAIGLMQGCFITFLKVQPFIATLAGMWIARGTCFFISDDSITINNRLFRILGQTKVYIPGLSNPAARTGPFVSLLVLVALLLLAIAIYVAHYTRFGRTIYAIGGNEQSARLMGLPVARTKILVYALNGFCSGLAGVTLAVYVASGHGLYADGFEMDVIASVVMGGTLLSGGSGYVLGTLFGVLLNVVIQTIIQFNGQLSSWWTRIVIGGLTLLFIGMQSMMLFRKERRGAAAVPGGESDGARKAGLTRRRRRLLVGGAALLVLAVGGVALHRHSATTAAKDEAAALAAACEDKPFRQDRTPDLLKKGAVIVYERNGGPSCVDELYAISADGKIIADDGANKVDRQISPAEVDKLLSGVQELGWFTDEMYDTWHARCSQCFGYYLTVAYKGKVKTVKGVDGGTDAPAKYWDAASLVIGVIPHFPAPAAEVDHR
jgi:simple sugar transport system permease protein